MVLDQMGHPVPFYQIETTNISLTDFEANIRVRVRNCDICVYKTNLNFLWTPSGTTENDCSGGMPSSPRRPSTTPATPSSSRGRTRDSTSRSGRSSGRRLTTSTARLGSYLSQNVSWWVIRSRHTGASAQSSCFVKHY